MSLEDYLRGAEAALAPHPGPYLLVGHSFGGWLARALAQRLGQRVAGVVLLGGLGGTLDRSAVEAYRGTRQSAMLDHCRLDLKVGKIVLRNPQDYITQVWGNEAIADIATSEPLSLIIETPRMSSLATGFRAPIVYVAADEDTISSLAHQTEIARSIGAALIRVHGGHGAPLTDPAWVQRLPSS